MGLRVVGLMLVALLFATLLGCGTSRGGAGSGAEPPSAVQPGPYEGAGPNLLENGDFEKADDEDSTLPAGWERLQSTAATVGLVARSGAADGSVALEIQAHPEGKYWQVLRQTLLLPDSATVYMVSFDGLVATTGRGRVALYLKKADDQYERIGVTDFSNTDWERHSFAARLPNGEGDGFELQLSHGDYKDPGSIVRFDNIVVQRAAQQ